MPIFHTLPQCHHVKTDGVRCGSPSLKGKRFCYYHYSYQKPHHTVSVPHLDEPRGLQFTIAGVLEGIQNRSYDPKQAYLMLMGCLIAVKNFKYCERPPHWKDVVRDLPIPDFDAELATYEAQEKSGILDAETVAKLKKLIAEQKAKLAASDNEFKDDRDPSSLRSSG